MPGFQISPPDVANAAIGRSTHSHAYPYLGHIDCLHMFYGEKAHANLIIRLQTIAQVKAAVTRVDAPPDIKGRMRRHPASLAQAFPIRSRFPVSDYCFGVVLIDINQVGVAGIDLLIPELRSDARQ